jgi:sn-glycerol 3-phosphate transport system permease protein
MILGVQLITITLAGFAFAHYEFHGRKILLFVILLQLMIPTTALLVPNFSTIRFLNLYDTRLAIAIPYFGSAFGAFLMRQAFLEVPHDLVDAGTIDGASWWQLLRHIYLPPTIPVLVARPLTAGLVRFTQLGEIGAQWSLLSAATLIVAAPLFIAFLVFQRRFIESFVHSGLK